MSPDTRSSVNRINAKRREKQWQLTGLFERHVVESRLAYFISVPLRRVDMLVDIYDVQMLVLAVP